MENLKVKNCQEYLHFLVTMVCPDGLVYLLKTYFLTGIFQDVATIYYQHWREYRSDVKMGCPKAAL